MLHRILIFLFLAQFLYGQTVFDDLKKCRSEVEYQAVISKVYETGKTVEAQADIEKFMAQLDPKNSVQIKSLYLFCDYQKMLKILNNSNVAVSKEFLNWLSNSSRLGKYLYTLDGKDDISKSLEIMKTLYEHDPKERDEFFNLMVALSVVWDQERPLMHHQMGPKILDYSTVTDTQRYDYFKSTYKKNAKLTYSKLSIQELIFVVDVPVPLSELEWSKENIKNTTKNWGKLYSGIVYNYKRLNNGEYDWIHGDYKLSEIQNFGGICVDQAYFTIMTSRAFGIPSVYFHGVGRNAGELHAWAGYMISSFKWDLEVGRYSQHNYVTGFAIDPQTNSEMTDHLLGFKCSAEVIKETYFTSLRLTEIANFYNSLNKKEDAFYCANLALRSNMYYLPAWDLVEKYYLDKKDNFKVVDLLKAKMKTFKDYPDFSYDIGQQAVSLLEEIGKEKDAEALAELIEKSIKTREDLSETYVREKVKLLYESKKPDEALRLFEKYLAKQVNMYDKIEEDIQLYLSYTKQYEQTKRATIYMRRFLKGDRYKSYKQYLAQAYSNDGDESRAAKIK